MQDNEQIRHNPGLQSSHTDDQQLSHLYVEHISKTLNVYENKPSVNLLNSHVKAHTFCCPLLALVQIW